MSEPAKGAEPPSVLQPQNLEQNVRNITTELKDVPEELVPELVGGHVDALAGVAGEGQHGVQVHVQVGRAAVPRGGGALRAGVGNPDVAQLAAKLR